MTRNPCNEILLGDAWVDTPPIPCVSKHQVPKEWPRGTFAWVTEEYIPHISDLPNEILVIGEVPWYMELREILLCYFDNLVASKDEYPLIIALPWVAKRHDAQEFVHATYHNVVHPLTQQGVTLSIHWYYASPSDSSTADVLVAFGYPGLYELAGV